MKIYMGSGNMEMLDDNSLVIEENEYRYKRDIEIPEEITTVITNNVHALDYLPEDKAYYVWRDEKGLNIKKITDNPKLRNILRQLWLGETISALKEKTIIRYFTEKP